MVSFTWNLKHMQVLVKLLLKKQVVAAIKEKSGAHIGRLPLFWPVKLFGTVQMVKIRTMRAVKSKITPIRIDMEINKTAEYRLDIDGLRAIAVLAVIFFHTGIPGFSGGFVGVDVFFVISGFLITTIILKDIFSENFSISRFYERRIRRIFPALFPVIAFVLVVGALILAPDDFAASGNSVLSTTFFYSNILFGKESGYFDAPSLQKPLLHTWSLAVEEQFYIAFPAIMLLIKRFLNARYIELLIFAAISSFIASSYFIHQYPTDTFYLVYTRAWELLTGSILALGFIPTIKSPILTNVLSVIGTMLIGYSIHFFNESTLFPGYNALLPVLGTVLILHTGRKSNFSIISKIISIKPMIFIGHISYSLYLWHWPLWVYSNYITFNPLDLLERAAIIIASFLIAAFSWKYIEQPFRGISPLLTKRNHVFFLAGFLMTISAAAGTYIYINKGIPERYAKANYFIMPPSLCRLNNWNKITTINDVPIYQIGNKNVEPSFIIWGDSHAERVAYSLTEKSLDHNVSGYAAFRAGFIPLLDIKVNDSNSDIFNNNILSFLKSHPNVKTIFLSGIWGTYANEHRYKDSHKVKLWDMKNKNAVKTNAAIMQVGFSRTVNTLEKLGYKIIIVSDVPEVGMNPKRLFWVKEVVFNQNFNTYLPAIDDYRIWNRDVDKIFKSLSAYKNTSVIHLENHLFDKNGVLSIIHNNTMLYDDADHLSIYGAFFISSAYDNAFMEISSNR